MERLKRGLLAGFLSVFFINFVSAQFYGSIGQFSFSNFLSSINPQDLTLMALFIIFFAVLFYAFGKFFRDSYGQPNRGIAGAVSFGISSLIVYGVYRTGFDLTGLFYGLGIGEGLLYPLVTIIILLGLIFIIWKYKIPFAGLVTAIGLFLILLVMFTDIFYEEFFIAVVGVALILLGLFLLWLKHRKKKAFGGYSPAYGYPTSPPPSQPLIQQPAPQIIYKQRQMSVYDLQQKYDAYKFAIFRTNLNPHQRQQMLKAMYMIRDYLKKLGASQKGQSPEQIEKTLRKNKLI